MTDGHNRVIIAEDNHILREIIAKGLAWLGTWEIVKVSGGAEALAALAGPGAVLAILDWKMEGGDGLDCARRIRTGENGVNPRLPVVLVTAAGDELTEAMVREAGIDVVLRKPFTLVQFQSAVRRLLA